MWTIVSIVSVNCNQAGSLDLSIPRLSGADDPLLGFRSRPQRLHEGGDDEADAEGDQEIGARIGPGVSCGMIGVI